MGLTSEQGVTTLDKMAAEIQTNSRHWRPRTAWTRMLSRTGCARHAARKASRL